ncbi:YlcI/YnfO family protein [Paraburkholderia sp. NPDC080076]|uniref:YlcI/YnfO family protein n=1 Tax=Paraburkholderia sp. NPDC080076 TaxID=3390605 RepID=UPI003CFD298D
MRTIIIDLSSDCRPDSSGSPAVHSVDGYTWSSEHYRRFAMKTATIPALRVELELRQTAEEVLNENESLSSFMEASLRESIAKRRLQREFVARGLAARDEARRTGEVFNALPLPFWPPIAGSPPAPQYARLGGSTFAKRAVSRHWLNLSFRRSRAALPVVFMTGPSAPLPWSLVAPQRTSHFISRDSRGYQSC